MKNRFTSRAIAVLKYAQQEAQEMEQAYIGTEHLLLGLLHERDGVSARALDELGVDFSAAKGRARVLEGEENQRPDNPYYTPNARRVMQFALEEAKELGHSYVGTEHILLGITRDSDTAAARLLASFGADLDELRETVYELLGEAEDEDGEEDESRQSREDGNEASKTPLLDRYGRSLNTLAAEEKMDPVIG
ncbi:MAG: ATP-dependent Clp protease ATP-binding subunit ClpC, partial [Schwartzia sp.]|nr:ATP-dependent Clp protease ATP-binding subunit ClpC [Schwartzia sp. (in: firmicutes)]